MVKELVSVQFSLNAVRFLLLQMASLVQVESTQKIKSKDGRKSPRKSMKKVEKSFSKSGIVDVLLSLIS